MIVARSPSPPRPAWASRWRGVRLAPGATDGNHRLPAGCPSASRRPRFSLRMGFSAFSAAAFAAVRSVNSTASDAPARTRQLLRHAHGLAAALVLGPEPVHELLPGRQLRRHELPLAPR